MTIKRALRRTTWLLDSYPAGGFRIGYSAPTRLSSLMQDESSLQMASALLAKDLEHAPPEIASVSLFYNRAF